MLRTLYLGSSPFTNVAAGARSTFNLLGARIPLVGTEVVRIHNITVGLAVELAADSRLLLMDSLDGGVAFNDSGGNFASFLLLVASIPQTAGQPIPFATGNFICQSGTPIISIVPGFTVSDGSTPPAQIQLAANCDVHNADAAAHRYQLSFQALVETV